MLPKRFNIFFLLICLTTTTVYATNWKKLTALDLKASYNYLHNDSAGGADRENPRFRKWLIFGYKKSLSKLSTVSSIADHNLLMDYYTNGFHDEHIIYIPYLKRFNFPRYWPLFTVYYEDDKLLVKSFSHNKNIPKDHMQLISCDGTSAKALMHKYVFNYFGNSKLNASWHINAPRLFFNYNGPELPKFKICEFMKNNIIKSYHLKWYALSKAKEFKLRQYTSYYYHPKLKARIYSNKEIWVSLSSFMPKTKTQISQMQRIIKMASSWRSKKLIIIDVRGNTGGNSVWGTEFLKALYGKPYFQQQTYKLQNSAYQWRTSSGNIKQLKGFYSEYTKQHFGIHSNAYKYIQSVIVGMQTALKKNYPYYPNTVSYSTPKQPNLQAKNLVRAKIFFLTDGRCASACLTFADELFSFPNVIQVGQPTHAASTYTETRVVTLPSGAKLYFPIKVQRFRERKSNQAYIPNTSHYYHGNINNTARLQQWMKKFIPSK